MLSKWIVALLLFLMAAASLMGVYMTHVVGGSLQFGDTPASMAIIAFVISAMAWTKQMICCMSAHCPVCNPGR